MKNIHLLPTDKPSRLYYNVGGALLFTSYENHNGVNIYITNDEEIKEGDWCVDTYKLKNNHYPIFRWSDKFRVDAKKIILTTDQDLIRDGVQAIDDEFLKWFINNPNCEKIDLDTFSMGNKILYNVVYLKEKPNLQKSTQMVEKLKEHLHSITSEQFQKEWTDIQDEGYIDGVINNVVDGVYVCKDINCPHCAYEAQEMWEDKLERDAAIDFAKWIAQDGWMSIWVEDKWMWECTNEQNELYAKYGYLTEEQLYELYLKSC